MKRFEDPRLLLGKGAFVDDMRLPDMFYAAVLRSPHARINAVEVSRARALPGVVAVLTGDDIAEAMKDFPPRDTEELKGMKVREHPVLAREKVCYVGQPVAVVVADDRYLARDALNLIEVDYEPLPPIVDPFAAVQEGSRPIHDVLGSNAVMAVQVGRGDMQAAFAQVDRVVQGRYDVPRLSPAPMESRGLLVQYQPEAGLLTLWSSTQVPQKVKTYLGRLLTRPAHTAGLCLI